MRRDGSSCTKHAETLDDSRKEAFCDAKLSQQIVLLLCYSECSDTNIMSQILLECFVQDKIRNQRCCAWQKWWYLQVSSSFLSFHSWFVYILFCRSACSLKFNIRFCNIWENYRRHLGVSDRLSFPGKAGQQKIPFAKLT